MATESEKCVDELLIKLSHIDALTPKLENDDDIQKGRVILAETQQFVDNNKCIIPAYTLKKVTDSLKNLEMKLSESQKSKLQFKFNFSNDRKVEIKSQATPLVSNDGEPKISKAFFGFRNVTAQELCLKHDEVDCKDVSLLDLEKCQVKIHGLANTVYIRNLKNTEVEVYLACRAISVINCENCRFKLICQQLRIDSTQSSIFETFTSARSMLESSKELVFKRLNFDDCPDIKDLLERANFQELLNNWDCIDDFDWLSPNTPSKNFTLM